jgi:hypothetical protein
LLRKIIKIIKNKIVPKYARRFSAGLGKKNKTIIPKIIVI